jgi:hypothetical protein
MRLVLNLKKSSSNKNVMSNNISKFARPVFRPTPVTGTTAESMLVFPNFVIYDFIFSHINYQCFKRSKDQDNKIFGKV